MLILYYLKIFLYATAIDTLWVFWFLSVSRKRKLLGAIMSMAMAAPAINGYMEIYDNRFLQIPYLLGLGTGTIIGMTLDDYIQERKKRVVR